MFFRSVKQLLVLRNCLLIEKRGVKFLKEAHELDSDFVKEMKKKFEGHIRPWQLESKYGGNHIVTCLTEPTEDGDRCAHFMQQIIDGVQAPITFEFVKTETKAMDTSEAILGMRRNHAAIKITTQHEFMHKRQQFVIDKLLDIYASVIYLNSWPPYNGRFPNLNLMIIIQNLADDFSDLEYEPTPGIIETLRHSEDDDTLRFLCLVFNKAVAEKRKKITFIHNIENTPIIDGHFLSIVDCMSKQFPEIQIEKRKLGSVVRGLFANPARFDVICSSERYGTALAAVSSSIAGGSSLFSSTGYGEEQTLFMPLQSKLSLTEYDRISCYGILRCCVDLMRYLCLNQQADALWQEIQAVMMCDKLRTEYFGGEATDCEVIDYIAKTTYEKGIFPRDLEISD